MNEHLEVQSFHGLFYTSTWEHDPVKLKPKLWIAVYLVLLEKGDRNQFLLKYKKQLKFHDIVLPVFLPSYVHYYIWLQWAEYLLLQHRDSFLSTKIQPCTPKSFKRSSTEK